MKKTWLLLLAVLLSTACQATGMGWIPSMPPGDKATFGFVYDGTTQTFSGSYHDRAAGVTFKGTGIMRVAPPPPGVKIKGGCLMGEPTYESRDRENPGFGTLTLIVCDGDGDGGMGLEDFLEILVTTGPYAGYRNAGNPSGNITVTQ
jgi:hypothetical protein